MYYSTFYPDRILRIHLFHHDDERDKIFTDICDKLKIKVTYEGNNLICTGLIPSEGDDEKKEVFDYAKASPDEKKEVLMKCLKVYKEEMEEPNTVVWKAFQPYLKKSLNITKSDYRSMEWKDLFKRYTS